MFHDARGKNKIFSKTSRVCLTLLLCTSQRLLFYLLKTPSFIPHRWRTNQRQNEEGLILLKSNEFKKNRYIYIYKVKRKINKWRRKMLLFKTIRLPIYYIRPFSSSSTRQLKLIPVGNWKSSIVNSVCYQILISLQI